MLHARPLETIVIKTFRVRNAYLSYKRATLVQLSQPKCGFYYSEMGAPGERRWPNGNGRVVCWRRLQRQLGRLVSASLTQRSRHSGSCQRRSTRHQLTDANLASAEQR